MMTAKKPNASLASSNEDIDQMSSKVAPGMEIAYIIKFNADAKVDYAYDLTVVTEREKFIVPIRARGATAALDFPDVLDFGLVPVKFPTEKPVLIRNIGEKPTKWHISTPANFTLDQHEGILEVGQSQQLVFTFSP
jgi:hydrocephalus-inducing protein